MMDNMPPNVVTTPNSESMPKTKITIPHECTVAGLPFIMVLPMIMMTPNARNAKSRKPKPVKNARIVPKTAQSKPPSSTNMPPISEITNAVVGFSFMFFFLLLFLKLRAIRRYRVFYKIYQKYPELAQFNIKI